MYSFFISEVLWPGSSRKFRESREYPDKMNSHNLERNKFLIPKKGIFKSDIKINVINGALPVS